MEESSIVLKLKLTVPEQEKENIRDKIEAVNVIYKARKGGLILRGWQSVLKVSRAPNKAFLNYGLSGPPNRKEILSLE